MAEDNADVRLLLNRAFRRCGTGSVEFFLNGLAVFEKAQELGVLAKVLLLDLEMPGMDGLQLLRTLAAEGYSSESTIIMFSTVDDRAKVEQAYALGASLYVSKPIGGVEYRQLARLCTACLYMHFVAKRLDAALSVADALKMAAENSATA